MPDLDTAHWVVVTANYVHRTYSQFVSQVDLRQEGWAYVYAHPKRMERLEHHENHDLTLKQAERFLFVDLRTAMSKFAREEKATKSGYRPEDDAQYASAALGYLLPYVLMGEVPTGSQNGTEGVSGGTTDPSEGGNLLAGYLDIKYAWESAPLNEEERGWLKLRHVEDLTLEECGKRMGGYSRMAALRAVQRAETKMLDQIGGRPFHRHSSDCECQADTWKTERYGLTKRSEGSTAA